MFTIFEQIPIFGNFLTIVLPFLLVLSIVVFIHEYGHYIVGRWCGIHAEVFSIGFGHVIWSRYDKRGTKWQIALIPLGGYVKFLGDMNPASLNTHDKKESADKGYFEFATLYQKSLTVIAGPFANFMLSFLIFSGTILWTGIADKQARIDDIHPFVSDKYDLQSGDVITQINGQTITDFSDFSMFIDMKEPFLDMTYTIKRNNQRKVVTGPFPFLPIVGAVMPVSPAQQAGLQAHDVILSFNGTDVVSFAQLRDMIFTTESKALNIVIWRDGKELTLEIHPRLRVIQTETGEITKKVSIGVYSGSVFEPASHTPSLLEAVQYGLLRTWDIITGSIKLIGMIFSGEISSKNLQGPVGIAHISGDVAKTGWLNFIGFIAIISTSIGFLNLLPIPILDGGHLLVYGYEAITGRKPNKQVINLGGIFAMIFLFSLMIFATFNDITRLFLYWG